jgi:formylglycine-generating enzyme required for sulfatase activity
MAAREGDNGANNALEKTEQPGMKVPAQKDAGNRFDPSTTAGLKPEPPPVPLEKAPPIGTAPPVEKTPPPAPVGLKTQTNSIGMKLVLVPAGEFRMGSAKGEAGRSGDEKQHLVRITPFYLGVTEITVGQFRQFVRDTGYKTEVEKNGRGGHGWSKGDVRQDRRYNWENPGWPQTDEHPAVNVTWKDAEAFCDWLSRKDGATYRLPTEAEWEYACRAGTTTAYSIGDSSEELVKAGNIADATAKATFPDWPCVSSSDGFVFTAPVGRFDANRFGLLDMHGNVWEMCSDWYGEYSQDSVTDPQGPSSGPYRVFRGGSWYFEASHCRSACRCRGKGPALRLDVVGFRVARNVAGT